MLEIQTSKLKVTPKDHKEKQENKFDFDYAPSLESTKIVKINAKNDLFINGKWVSPESGKYFATLNPATNEVLAEIAEGNETDVEKAVSSARAAFATWSKLSGKE